MPIPLIPAALALGGLAIAFGSLGGRDGADEKIPSLPPKKDREKSAEKAKKATQKRDWQQAAAEALASRSSTAVKKVAAAMKRAGKSDEARALLAAWKEIRDQILLEKKEAEEKEKEKTKPKRKKRKRKTKPVVVIDDEEEEEEEEEVLPEPTPPPKPPKVVSPEKEAARSVARMLASSQRYQEDRALVTEYQEDNGLTADGKYGPGTAKTLWNSYRIVPPNPYYWSSVASRNPGLIADYDRFLQGIAQARPASAGRIDQLRSTLGK